MPADRARRPADRLVALRERYEAKVRDIVAQLALPAEVDRDLLRLFLIGALNWTQVWYRPDGKPPRAIARQLVGCLRAGAV